ncbi:hypothetical protein L0U88_18170 [Flavihumibacter sp. RY-1]|uniref:Uncharacterized protein n=1 Tax=Flavihumibacter fluminis TaxID=2909236 RepID=A0ABS9BP36_9BACT|nr:hypothetical protein [Flavihumibacter fluminis]MCF1716574.1 hypothetical protein [Flavihumibacter fluminis]
MMQITVHFGVIALGLGAAVCVGLFFRMGQVGSLRKQIMELEREKMQDHAEILQLQKQLADLQHSRSSQQTPTPVVPLIEKDLGAGDLSKNKRASQ